MPKKSIIEEGKKKQVEIKRALSSLILNPGDKFEVINPQMNNSFPPGTMGYFSYVQGRSDQGRNSLNVRVTVLRRGKGGKPRLESNTMTMPVFHEKHTVLDRSLKIDAECLSYFVLQRRIPVFVNLLTAEPEDFLGWCFSYTNFLHFLSKTTDFKNIWPKEKDRLNRLLHLSSEWNEHNDVVMEKYSNIEVRERAVASLRMMETKLYRRLLKYKLSNAEHTLFSSREYVSIYAPQDKHATLTKKCVEQTHTKYEKAYMAIKTQYNKSTPKNKVPGGGKLSWQAPQYHYTEQDIETAPEEEVASMANTVPASPGAMMYVSTDDQDVTFDWGNTNSKVEVSFDSAGNMTVNSDNNIVNGLDVISEDDVPEDAPSLELHGLEGGTPPQMTNPETGVDIGDPPLISVISAMGDQQSVNSNLETMSEETTQDDAPDLPSGDEHASNSMDAFLSDNDTYGNESEEEVVPSDELTEEPDYGPEWDELEEDEDEEDDESYPPDNNVWTTKLGEYEYDF